MTDPNIDPQSARIEAIASILQVLLPLGVTAAEALIRAVKAVHGPDLTPAEMLVMIDWLSEDTEIRRVLAHADANGGGQ
jgi:hypothetical protein